MRKLLYIGFFVTIGFFDLVPAQYADQSNRFNQNQEMDNKQQRADASVEDQSVADGAQNKGPSNPGNLPIDDYIPLLMLAGIGLILYINKRKKTNIN